MANSTKMKAFAAGGLEALTAYIKQMKLNADSLQEDFAELAQKVSEALQEVGGAIQSLDATKAYVAARMGFTLNAASWVEDSSGTETALEYPYKYTLALQGVTADTRVDAVLNPVSASLAGLSDMCPVTETAANAVIFRSRTAPEDNLSGTLYITQGETETEEETT